MCMNVFFYHLIFYTAQMVNSVGPDLTELKFFFLFLGQIIQLLKIKKLTHTLRMFLNMFINEVARRSQMKVYLIRGFDVIRLIYYF